MADTKLKPKTGAGRRVLRVLIWFVGIFLLLLVAAYFVGTSGAFFKRVILPKVSDAMNADVTAADASISPFKEVTLRDVKVKPRGAEQLLQVATIHARYNLRSIIGGNIVVDEVTVENPTITIIENADGTSNLDPITKKQAESKPKAEIQAPSKKESGKPTNVDIKSVALKNATIQKTTTKDGVRQTIELANVNLTISNIKNGANGKMDLSAALSMSKTASPSAAAASMQGLANGSFAFGLTSDLKPASINGNAVFSVGKATGEFAELSTLTARLDCDATPTEVKQISLRFAKANSPLGEVRVSGPFDAEKSEGKLRVEIISLDKQVLNLAGAASGIDFGTTTINSTNDVTLAKAGKEISLAGLLEVSRFQVTRQQQTSPTLDLRCDYDVLVDNNAQAATLKKLKLAGTQNQKPLLQADLTSPMTIAWGNANNAVGDATLNATVTGLNLADWKAFAPDAEPGGMLNAKAKLVSQQAGKQLSFDVESQIEKLSARFGSNQISEADIRAIAKGRAVELKQFTLEDYKLELAQKNQPAVTVNGSGTFDKASGAADLQVAVQVTLTRLLALFPQPDAKFTSGSLDFKGHVTQKGTNQNVTGQVTLTELTGHYGTYRFASFGTWVDVDVAMKGKVADVNKASGLVREGQNAGGRFEATGNFDTDKKAGHLSLKLADFNQNGLRPFLESAMGDKKLVSVELNTTAALNMEANGDASVKADLQLAKLVVSDPKSNTPGTPLEAKAQVDAAVAKKVAQINKCQLTLTPTERAKNELNLTGNVDLSKSNAITGAVRLVAESLDVTRYYDLFSGKPAATEARPATPSAPQPAPAPSPAPSDKEPDAVKLPFQNFTCDVSIGRFYLREVDMADLKTTAKLDGSHVVLKPAQLTLNGAPVTANVDLDLGVPGYKYDVSFGAQGVPLAPLVNSFQPERKGQIGGAFVANTQLKGEGVTGASLQKNLTGQFNIAATNLNLSTKNVKSPMLKLIIQVTATIPDLIKNPTGGAANLLGSFLGSGATSGGLADDVNRTTIDDIILDGNAGGGHIKLAKAEVHSTAFLARANGGDVGIMPILTNSTLNIPVNLSLSRGLAIKTGLASSDTPTNVAFVDLPHFFTMKGTAGDPKKEYNTVALLGLAAKVGGSVAGGGKTGGILNTVGGFLGGRTTPVTNAPSATNTNQPATTNQPPPAKQQPNTSDLIRGLGGLLGGKKAPATNQPPPPK